MSFVLFVLVQIVWFIAEIINAQTIYNPSISNSSGQYFISQQSYDLNGGEIICDSDILCYIQCNHESSCRSTNIHCNNASKCIIECSSADSTCYSANFYISSRATIITCDAYYACYGNNIIYTDFTNYPSSNVILTCGGYRTCDGMFIQDISNDAYSTITSYADPSKFKILCKETSASSCYPVLSEPYPLIKPSINNMTGEYYTNIGSYITIKCTHSSLCLVDCTNGGCKKSTINCGDSDKCMIICDDSWSFACSSMHIIADGMNQFNFQCMSPKGCYVGNYNIININIVNIKCNSCRQSIFNIENVNHLYVDCNGDGSCRQTKWYIDNITNDSSIICDGGCQEMKVDIDGSNYFDILCMRWWGDLYKSTFLGRPCDDLEINAVSIRGLDLECQDKETCGNINICLDETLNIDCLGNKSCNLAKFCDDPIASSINCIGLNSSYSCYISIPTQFPTGYPTISPSYVPSEITGFPTSIPTSTPTSIPTQSPHYHDQTDSIKQDIKVSMLIMFISLLFCGFTSIF